MESPSHQAPRESPSLLAGPGTQAAQGWRFDVVPDHENSTAALEAAPGRMRHIATPNQETGPHARPDLAAGGASVGYPEIADALRSMMASGELPPNQPLPSESQLMGTYGVARTTVRRALKVLSAEGLIEAQQGRGWRVSGGQGASGPAFTAVADDLRSQIRAGTLPVGSRLPSESGLSEQYGCARGTIRRALAELEVAGLVEIRPGIGRFVTRKSTRRGTR